MTSCKITTECEITSDRRTSISDAPTWKSEVVQQNLAGKQPAAVYLQLTEAPTQKTLWSNRNTGASHGDKLLLHRGAAQGTRNAPRRSAKSGEPWPADWQAPSRSVSSPDTLLDRELRNLFCWWRMRESFFSGTWTDRRDVQIEKKQRKETAAAGWLKTTNMATRATLRNRSLRGMEVRSFLSSVCNGFPRCTTHLQLPEATTPISWSALSTNQLQRCWSVYVVIHPSVGPTGIGRGKTDDHSFVFLLEGFVSWRRRELAACG